MEKQVTIGIKEIIVIALCLIIYIVAIEFYEHRVYIARQGQLVEQETSFTYEPPTPPTPPVTDDGQTILIDTDE